MAPKRAKKIPTPVETALRNESLEVDTETQESPVTNNVDEMEVDPSTDQLSDHASSGTVPVSVNGGEDQVAVVHTKPKGKRSRKRESATRKWKRKTADLVIGSWADAVQADSEEEKRVGEAKKLRRHSQQARKKGAAKSSEKITKSKAQKTPVSMFSFSLTP